MNDEIDFSALTDDGDTDDKRRLILHIEHDPDSNINDYDCYGKYETASDRDTERPDDFDGSARKLWMSGGFVWWQPMKDTYGWTDDANEPQFGSFDQFALTKEGRKYINLVRDLIEYGFKQVGLELQELVTDSHGGDHWITIDTRWIGGVDAFYAELVTDLFAEMGPWLKNRA